MSEMGITKTTCAGKGIVKMSSTIGNKFDRIGVLLDNKPGCTSRNRRRRDEGRNFS